MVIYSLTFIHQKKLYIFNTIIKKENKFDTLEVFRESIKKIAKKKLKNKFAELKEYLNKNKLQTAK